MPFLIQGNAEDIMTAFGTEYLIQLGGTEEDVTKDLERTKIFGTRADNLVHQTIWMDPEQSPRAYYCQGNMFAGNVIMVFGPFLIPLIKPNESIVNFKQNAEKSLNMAYVDTQSQKARGFAIYYRKDDPTKWVIVSSKNQNKLPKEAGIQILTSFDPKPFLKTQTCTVTKVAALDNDLVAEIGSPQLKAWVSNTLSNKGVLNPVVGNINAFLQNVALDGDAYLDNDELLENFVTNIKNILESKHLKLLADYGVHLEPRQVGACLDPQSELYQLLSAFEPGPNSLINKTQLETMILLDLYSLNHRQDLIRKQMGLRIDEEDDLLENDVQGAGVDSYHFINRLNELSKQSDCLPRYLEEDDRLNTLHFILYNKSFINFFKQLIQLNSPVMEATLSELAQLEWRFPKDSFCHTVICEILFANPEISFDEASQLVASLKANPNLERVFNPKNLAQLLFAEKESSVPVAVLQDIGNYFVDTLNLYDAAAQWTLKPLSSELIMMLGSKYLENPEDHAFLQKLTFCTKPKQIEACYVLHALDFSLNEISLFVSNDALVSAINILQSKGLGHCIADLLKTPSNLLAFNAIHELALTENQAASLILLATVKLASHEFAMLVAAFNQYPLLGTLICRAHNEGVAAEHIKALAFTPNLHLAAKLLHQHNVDYSFDDLVPFTCQLMRFIVELVDANNEKKSIINYLRAVLPSVMQYFKGKLDQEALFVQLDEQFSSFKHLMDEESLALGNHIVKFLKNQALVFIHMQPIVKSNVIAEELGEAIARVNQLEATEGNREVFYQQIGEGFTALDETTEFSKSTTYNAVDALVACHSQESQNTPHCEVLLKDENLSKAIVYLSQQNKVIDDLLAMEEPLRKEVAASLIALSQAAPGDMAACNYAMANDDSGKDFRRLLTKNTFANQQALWTLLKDGIEARRMNSAYETIKPLIADQRAKNQAYHLDETLILINRLRDLQVDDKIIAFMVQENPKSRYFCKTILKVEAECQKIRNRLQAEAPTKHQSLEGPERLYRAGLYLAIYEAFNSNNTDDNSKDNLRTKINEAEAHINDIVEIDRHPWLRVSMEIIANIVTIACTLGVANYVHMKNTGDFFFFARPASSEAIRRLDLEVESMVSLAAASA